MEVGTTQIRPDGTAQVGAPGLNESAFRTEQRKGSHPGGIPISEDIDIHRHTSVSDISGGQSVGEKLRANATAVVIKEIARTEQRKGSHPGGIPISEDIEKMKNDLSRWRNTYSVMQAKQDSINNKNNEELFTMADLCSGGCLDTIAAT